MKTTERLEALDVQIEAANAVGDDDAILLLIDQKFDVMREAEINDDNEDCRECGGGGEVINWRRVNSASPEPPMRRCPRCRGTGVEPGGEGRDE